MIHQQQQHHRDHFIIPDTPHHHHHHNTPPSPNIMYQALSHQLAHLHSNSTDTQFHSPPPSTTTSRTPSRLSPPPHHQQNQNLAVANPVRQKKRPHETNSANPTCAGQESPHKLVILQCAIEYIEEMQRCIKGIKVEEEGGLMMLARATCDKRVEGDRAVDSALYIHIYNTHAFTSHDIMN
ncbi:hypothetical protein BC829DRAFT_381840 [Chytridium lagenaria]|nr:hypothetical protein BC829DRAFT_381840 [Chytridium lagenaria]